MWQDAFFFISLYFVRPLTVLIHELGHAIPAFLLTRKKVLVYVGSYGSPKHCLRLPLGVMDIYLHYIPFSWNKGVCIPGAKEISVNKQIIYTLTGPMASLMVAVIALYFRQNTEGYSYLGFFLILFLCSAVFDLFHNLIPNQNPIILDDGKETFNDGKSLAILFRFRKLEKNCKEAYPLYQSKKYKEAYALIKKAIEQGAEHPLFYKLAISCLANGGPSANNLDFLRKTQTSNHIDKEDLINIGACYSMLEQNEDATKIFKDLLSSDPKNFYAHANLGYLDLSDKKYESALEKFTLVTTLNPKFPYGYACRGMSKIYLGDLESGLQDIRVALSLNPDDPSSHSALGVYEIKRREYSKALQHFEKARTLNPNIHKIEQLIARAREGRDIDDL